MARNIGLNTQPPKEITLIIGAILWIIGFADTILGVLTLGSNYGLWALALGGLLVIIGSLVDGI
jgi:hypothetical protein